MWRISFVAIMCGLLVDAGRVGPPPTSLVRLWFPVEVGDRWVYQHEQRDAGPHGMADPKIERWKTEETIDSVTNLSTGTLVIKSVRAYDHEMLNGWVPENDSVQTLSPVERILIRNDCIYPDQDRNSPPTLCFPMTVGGEWGRTQETDPSENDVWHVQALNGDPFGVTNGQTYHAAAHEGAGYFRDMWYAKGIGVLQSVGLHHGTYWEDRSQLRSTTFAGQTTRYSLLPAKTVPLSESDCTGVGWRHFVRGDGSAFASWKACIATVRR
jgi:hypothetical protein